MAAPTSKDFKDLIEEQKRTTFQLMTDEEQAAARAERAANREKKRDAQNKKGNRAGEKEKDRKRKRGDKNTQDKLSKIAEGLGDLSDDNKKAGKAAGKMKGLKAMLVGTAFAAASLAIVAFLNSPYWEKTKAFMIDKLVPMVEMLWTDYIKPIGEIFFDYFLKQWENIKELFSGLSEAFELFGEGKWWEGITKFFSSIGTFVIDALDAAITAVWNSIMHVFGKDENQTDSVLGSITGFLSDMMLGFHTWIAMTWKDIKTAISDTFTGIVDWFKLLFSDPTAALSKLWDTLTAGYAGIWEIIWTPVKAGIAWVMRLFGWDEEATEVEKWTITDFIMVIFTKIKTWFTGLFSWGEAAGRGDDGKWTLSTFITGVWTKVKTWFTNLFSWASTEDDSESFVVKTIKAVIMEVKSFFGKMFKFDSTSDIITSIINVVYFLPNLVKDMVASVTSWLLGLFGFDEAAQKVANVKNWSIGSMIMGVLEKIFGWFKGLLDFDFTGLIKKIPGAETVMEFFGTDEELKKAEESGLYKSKGCGDRVLDRHLAGRASNKQLEAILADGDLSDSDEEYIKNIIKIRERKAAKMSDEKYLRDKALEEAAATKAGAGGAAPVIADASTVSAPTTNITSTQTPIVNDDRVISAVNKAA